MFEIEDDEDDDHEHACREYHKSVDLGRMEEGMQQK
jgi:hypothetical protein